jgi:hypothetical protein
MATPHYAADVIGAAVMVAKIATGEIEETLLRLEHKSKEANYVLSNRLSGIMTWEIFADDDQDTLVNAVAAALA